MTGVVGAAAGGTIFKASINSDTLPTIAATDTIAVGKVWVAHGVCKLVEAAAYSIAQASSSSIGQSQSSSTTGTSSGGTDGGADSGTSGWDYTNSGWATCWASCSRYCAHYCARYCARYCGMAGYGFGFGYGYGFGFGYGYGTARGYSSDCTAIGVNGSTSWTQVVPSGFTVTTWLYYEEQANA